MTEIKTAFTLILFDTDILFLWKVIGCMTDCYHPSPDERFSNPYPPERSNTEQNPAPWKLPVSATLPQRLKYRHTCATQVITSSDSGSSESSVSQLPSLNPPIINGESTDSNNPYISTTDASRDMIQTKPSYVLKAETAKDPIDVSLNPDTSASTDSTFVSSLNQFWEGITSRSVRMSPRDFKAGAD